jgi:hypothetical protein
VEQLLPSQLNDAAAAAAAGGSGAGCLCPLLLLLYYSALQGHMRLLWRVFRPLHDLLLPQLDQQP